MKLGGHCLKDGQTDQPSDNVTHRADIIAKEIDVDVSKSRDSGLNLKIVFVNNLCLIR